MAFPLGALIGAGASILGGILGGNSAKEASAQQFEQNAELQKRNFDFQERMYKNRHTYEVEDLRSAGLNPILSAGGSPGTPGGSTSSVDSTASARSASTTAASQGVGQAASLLLQQKQVDSQAALNSAAAEREYAQADVAREQVHSGWYPAQVSSLEASARQAREEARLAAQNVFRVQQEIRNMESQRGLIEQQVQESRERVRTEKTIQGRNEALRALSIAQAGLVAFDKQFRAAQTFAQEEMAFMYRQQGESSAQDTRIKKMDPANIKLSFGEKLADYFKYLTPGYSPSKPRKWYQFDPENMPKPRR